MPSPFVADKQMFFQSVTQDTSIADVNVLAKQEKDFRFLTTHLKSIELEFSNHHAVLKNNRENSRISLLYCYYTATLLKNYYDDYSLACANAIKYSELCDDLKKSLDNQPVILPKKKTLLDTLANDLADLSKIPFSNAKLRNSDGKANIHRLSTRFSIITVQQTLLLANQYHYLDKLEQMMGWQFNIAILDSPIGVYNALSVALFGFRFLLNLSMLLKHTFIPAPGETNLTMSERLYEEIKKRHYQMTNDLIWGTVNIMCNYAAYFNVPAPVTSYLMIGFTVFDVIWLTYALYQTDNKYESKRAEYVEYMGTLAPGSAEYLIEKQKLDQLALEHEKARSEVIFYLAAASILLGAFAAVFLLSPPALVPVCFLVCNIAIAMYLSGGQYGEYKEKCLVVQQQKDNGIDVTTEAKKDVQNAWDNLGFAMAKNTIAPLMIMGAFTISFPLAILFTVSYMAYECGYLQRLPELFLGCPEAEVVAPRMG